MPFPFLHLPVELQLIIADFVDPIEHTLADKANGLLPLSSTCKTLRAIFAHRIFRIIKFTNEPRNAKLSLSIVKKWGRYAQKLSFVVLNTTVKHTAVSKHISTCATCQSWAHRQDELLCPAAQELLLGKHTKCAMMLLLWWNLDKDNGPIPASDTCHSKLYRREKGVRHTYCTGFEEDLEQTIFEELYVPWRAMMRQVWKTLAQNENVHFLNIAPMVARPSEVFFSAEWKLFLSRLWSLSMCFDEGYKDHPGVCTFAGLHQFASCLNNYILLDAHSLIWLTLSGPAFGIMGYQPRIPFDEIYLPSLRDLELKTICLSQGLVQFLNKHSKGLEILSMNNCYSCCSEDGEDLIKWADLFRAVNHRESAMARFRCWPNDDDCFDPFPIDVFLPQYVPHSIEANDDDTYSEDGLDEFCIPPGKRLFPYAVADTHTGNIDADPTMVTDSFEKGEDQNEYDVLMAHCEKNTEAQKRSSILHHRAEL